MSKNIFINNLDTYVSQAIFKELRNDQLDEDGNKPEGANLIFGTYIGKDSSVNPEGVKKMLKVRVTPTVTIGFKMEAGVQRFAHSSYEVQKSSYAAESNLECFVLCSVPSPTWP